MTKPVPDEVVQRLADGKFIGPIATVIADGVDVRALAREVLALRDVARALLSIEDGEGEGFGGLHDDTTYYDAPCQTRGLTNAVAALRALLPENHQRGHDSTPS